MSDDLINKKEASALLRKRSQQLVGIYGDLGGALSGAAKLINELPTADRPQEWIPCSERLPEEEGEYLVTQKNGSIGRYVFNYNGNSEEYFKRCATAWMPLPAPWKGADDE